MTRHLRYTNHTLAIIFFIISSSSLFASINFNKNCKEGFKNVMSLEHEKAKINWQLEQNDNPNNTVADYVEMYSYFMKYVTTENPISYNKYNKKYDEILDKLGKENKNDPYRLYLISDIYLQASILEATQENYLTALYLFKKSYSSINENIELFPNFILNNKTKGLQDVILGSIPDSYNLGMSIIGLSGDLKAGISKINTLLQTTISDKSKEAFFLENLMIFTFLHDKYIITEGEDKILYNIYSDDKIVKKYSNSLLFIFSRASFYQIKKKNKEAIEALQIVNYQPKRVNENFCFLNYMMGQNLLYNHSSQSEIYFQRYLNNYSSNKYKASSHQMISWSRLLSNDKQNYLKQRSNVTKETTSRFDFDKQALKEAESKEIPNIHLLKSRLFFDGGFYKKADSILQKGFELQAYKTERNNVEYTYRKGRIFDEWGYFTKAETYYLKTITDTREMKYYYAAKSALQLGYGYEKKGYKNKARQMYKLILDLDFDEYKTGITQKAKAGLNRTQ